jgi:hypothetical protein
MGGDGVYRKIFLGGKRWWWAQHQAATKKTTAKPPRKRTKSDLETVFPKFSEAGMNGPAA